MSALDYSIPAKVSRTGYGSVVEIGEVQFCIFASSLERLEDAFNHVTDGKTYFQKDRVNRLLIINNPPKKKLNK
jgi:hypothetical protein